MTAACLAGRRCRSYDRRTQTAAATEAPLCPTCLTAATADIGQLTADYRDLEQQLSPTLGQWGDGQPGHSGEPPIPIRCNVEALQREIWYLSTAWAEVLADHHRLADPPWPVRPGRAVQNAVATIAVRVDALAQIGATLFVSYPRDDDATVFGPVTLSRITGAQGVLDLADTHRRARTLLGLTAPTRSLPGYCQNRSCGRPELRQDNGSDTVWCGHCAARMSRDDYERLCMLFTRTAA